MDNKHLLVLALYFFLTYLCLFALAVSQGTIEKQLQLQNQRLMDLTVGVTELQQGR